ncbi:methylated-DNA--protein-cysteine methyltransferase-like isoform X2 [Liolophura sinensis]
MPIKPGLKCHYGPTNTFLVETAIGLMELVCCPKGVHSLSQLSTITDANFKPRPGQKVCVKSQLYQDNGYTYKPAVQCVEWLRDYFSPGRITSEPPRLCITGAKEGSFTGKVWKTLAEKVTYGQTISYRDLAVLCECPNGSRAIGQAMRSNPYQLIVPCHRVIQSSGKLGNYSSGQKNTVKEWLLNHEEAI